MHNAQCMPCGREAEETETETEAGCPGEGGREGGRDDDEGVAGLLRGRGWAGVTGGVVPCHVSTGKARAAGAAGRLLTLLSRTPRAGGTEGRS